MLDTLRIIDRQNSSSIKWNREHIQAICGNPDAEPFWVADMDLAVAQPIQQELEHLVTHGVYGYPTFSDTIELFSAWTKKRHNWTIEESLTVISPGMLVSVSLLVELLSNTGDGIIVPLPAYHPFLKIVSEMGRTLIPFPLEYNQKQAKFSLNVQAFEQLCLETHPKIFIFCSPHNPTGIVWDAELIKALAHICARNNIAVISDEIHADMVYAPKQHTPFANIASQVGCKSVTCMAPSKTFNIAGEHFSVSVFTDTLLAQQYQKRLSQLNLSSPSLFSLVAARAGYKYGYEWLQELNAYLQGNIAAFTAILEEQTPLISVIKPEASFIAFLDCTHLIGAVEHDAHNHPQLYDPSQSPNGGLLSRFFGQRAGVAMNDGTSFGGLAYKPFVRFNFGTHREAIEAACIRIATAVATFT